MSTNKIPLGDLAQPGAQRDAVHVAIAPCEAAERLSPGEHVGLTDDGRMYSVETGDAVGIVDPFLDRQVMAGQVAYLMLFPNTVTGMRHHWKHPAFGGEDIPVPLEPVFEEDEVVWLTCASARWMLRFTDKIGMTEKRLMEHLDANYEEFKRTGDMGWEGNHTIYGMDTPYEDMPEMWRHYSKLREVSVEGMERETPFSCSC
jgi:hypothetical protein